MKVAFVVFLGLIALSAVAADGDSNVLDLNPDNFDDTVAAADLTLVEFFAPWCGHCKALAPEYESAADTLADNEKIQIAKVDCTEHRELCTKYGVEGFPTLKVFRQSTENPSAYESARKADAIVSFMKKQTLPAVSDVTDKASIDALLEDEKFAVVGFFNGESDASAAFHKVANSLRNEYLFAAVSSDADAVAAEFGVQVPGVVVVRSFDTPQVAFEGDVTESALREFVTGASFPLFGEIGPDNFKDYVSRGFPLVWFFLDPADETTSPAATEAAANFAGKLSFVHLDGVKWAQHAKSFGIGENLPGVVVEDREGGFNYVFPEGNDVTGDSLTKWAQSFLDGDLQPTLKSEEPPADNSGPVTVVVGTTYEEIVLDETKDVLVEFYAPWCGHCKSLAPKYEELGERFANTDSVVIAKIDATENDTPVKVSGFPTLKFFAANDKTPMDYNGERSTDAMEAFVREHASTLTGEEGSDDAAPSHEEL